MDRLTPPAGPAGGAEDPVGAALAVDEETLDGRWERLKTWLDARFGRDTNLEGILFLIGIQSRGQGFEPKLGKEVKQDLIMEGTYRAFEALGLYRRAGTDAEGGPVWVRAGDVPRLSVDRQEKLLRVAILAYFEREVGPAAFG